MIKTFGNLRQRFSSLIKRNAKHAKILLASNLALGLIALPTPTAISSDNSSLLIPQDKLEAAFHIQENSQKENENSEPQIQIPTKFIYLSQGFSSFHPGIDLASEIGIAVKPIMKGIIKEAGFTSDGYGNRIIIDHGNGIESLYAHLSKIEVKKGDVVDLTSVIGLIGTTGHSTGPHLHLEIHKNDKPINPLSFLPKFGSVDHLEPTVTTISYVLAGSK